MRIGKNTPWLVKSSGGRILGPYFDKDLINRLRTREIALIDEVSRPCGRWIYIRDEPAFATVTEEIRQRNSRMSPDADDSTARADLTLTPTNTVSLTDPVDPVADDLTEEISNIHYTEPKRERVHETITSETFVFENDRMVRAEANNAVKWLWATTILVIFVAIGFVAFRHFVARPIQDRALAHQSLGDAQEAMDVGEYERALHLYKRAYESIPSDQKTYLPYALLLVQIENQTVLSRRLLENLLSTQERDREKIHTASAIAFIAEKKFKEAESHLSRALEVDQLFYPAMINMGILGLEVNDPEKANNNLQLAVKEGSKDGVEYLYLTKALFDLYEKDKDVSYLQQANQFLEQFVAKSHDYLQETLVASIFIDSLLGQTHEISAKINRFLETDPMQTELHRHDLFIYRRAFNWSQLSQWCLRATENLDPMARVVAFESICLLKAGELKDASQKIEDAILQAPRDSLVHAVYGFVLEKTNAIEQARAAYDKALDFDLDKKLQLPRLLKARLCERLADYLCASAYWDELLNINRNSLPAIAGMAADHLGRGDLVTAGRMLRRGKVLSQNYGPFLSMSARLEASR